MRAEASVLFEVGGVRQRGAGYHRQGSSDGADQSVWSMDSVSDAFGV